MKGLQEQKGRVLLKQNDLNPYVGKAEETSGVYMLDIPMMSVVYDAGEKQSINRVLLRTIHEGHRLTPNFVGLYASDDNESYEAITEYCMMPMQSSALLYNFSVKARYIKVHFTYYKGAPNGYEYENELSEAIVAYYCDRPLLDCGADFASKTTLTVKNEADTEAYNKIVTVTLAELEIDAKDLKADLSDIRFRTADFEVPHYYNNGKFYLRVMRIPAKATATVTVLYGNEAAENISCGEATLEVEYGTKWAWRRLDSENCSWRNSVAVMPDGSLHRMGKYSGGGRLAYERSLDGGHTWLPTEIVPGTQMVGEGGGYIVDFENNKVFFLCYGKGRKFFVFRSDDSGYHWELVQTIEDLPGSVYADGIKLSCYDGEGPNVDYVFHLDTVNKQAEQDGPEEASALLGEAVVLYSRDGGKSWTLSETRLCTGTLPLEKDGTVSVYWSKHESGMSESSLWEKADGTLVMYSRYQGRLNGSNQVDRFIMSYSYDHGVTWQVEKTSRVRTTETQPVIINYEGTPVLLWGGNNVQGFRAYDRFPFSVGYSVDDAENFIGIQDIFHQTVLQNRLEHRPQMERENLIITNPDIAVKTYRGVDHANLITTGYFMLVENFKDFLYKTKGAFDSFESFAPEADGWVTVSGIKLWSETSIVPGEAPKSEEQGATHGKKAMHLFSETEVSRSVPYAVDGEVFFDLFVNSMAGGYTLELQSSYTRKFPEQASPVRIRLNEEREVCYIDGKGEIFKTGLKVNEGANKISVRFNGKQAEAAITVNGKTAPIVFNNAYDNCVCFVHMRNGKDSDVSVDSFGLADFA